MSSANRFSYPLCPACSKKGKKVEPTVNICQNDSCDVELYWFGGYSRKDQTF